MGRRGVENQRIDLVVKVQAAAIEIGTACKTIEAVNHHDLAVVEAALEIVHMGAPTLEPVHIVIHDLRRDWDVALVGHNDFDTHAPLDCLLQGPTYGATQGEVGIDNLDEPLGVTDCADEGAAYDVRGETRLAVDHGNRLVAAGGRRVLLESLQRLLGERHAGIEVCAVHMLTSSAIPDAEKNLLIARDGIALNPEVDVPPLAKLSFALDIVVGDIHAPAVGGLAVDDDNLAVVPAEDVGEPREVQRVIDVDFQPTPAELLQFLAPQGLIVGVIAKGVKEKSHLDPLLGLDGQEVKERVGDGVVPEVKVLHVNCAAGLSYGAKEIVKLLLPILEKDEAIIGAHVLDPGELAGKKRVRRKRWLCGRKRRMCFFRRLRP